MLSTNRHERQSVHPWYMRRRPLVSASLRKRRFLCLETERRNPAAWTMQQKCCNNNTRSLPASPDTIRHYLYTFHPPPDRPTNNERPRDVQKRIRQIRHHHPHSHHTEKQCKIDPPVASVPTCRFLHSTRDLPDLTLPHLTSPFLDPTQKRKTSSLIHPSIREDRSLTISKSSEIQ